MEIDDLREASSGFILHLHAVTVLKEEFDEFEMGLERFSRASEAGDPRGVMKRCQGSSPVQVGDKCAVWIRLVQ